MGNGEPDLSDPNKFITLTTPGSTTANRIHTFAAPADANLAANTTYHLYLANSDGGVPGNIHRTSSNAEDDGGAPGWSIGNKRYWRNGNSGPWTDDTTNIVRMQINGRNAPLPTDATLSGLAIEGATGGETITLSPDFAANTIIYTTSVGNRIDTAKLTATKNEANATVVITGDDDTNTKNEANLDLDVGDNALTVTVTAADTTVTKTYTVTVTRAAFPPAPTNCPANITWCTTMGVGYTTTLNGETIVDIWGYRSTTQYGDLRSTTFSHEGISYTVSAVDRIKTTIPGFGGFDTLNLSTSPELPDGTVLKLGSRTFTVDSDSDTTIAGQKQWDIEDDPVIWTEGQHVTTSLTLPAPTAPSAPRALTANADGATGIDLEWTAPANNGGTIILGYNIQHSPDGSSNWTNLN